MDDSTSMSLESRDRYRRAEYTNSFNPEESMSFMEESGSLNDAFPLPLNPLYDLQALVMVSYEFVE